MKAEIMKLFISLMEYHMKEAEDFDIVGITAIEDENATYAAKIKITEYEGDLNETYERTLKIFVDRENKDADLLILDSEGTDCIKLVQRICVYNEEKVKMDNDAYKNIMALTLFKRGAKRAKKTVTEETQKLGIERFEITCYYKKTIYQKTREEMLDMFLSYIINSEGSEKERYTNIYTQLKMGYNVCSDEKE